MLQLLVLLQLTISAFAEIDLPLVDLAELPDVVGSSEKSLVLFTRGGVCSACETADAVTRLVVGELKITAYQVKQKSAKDESIALYVDRLPTIVLFLRTTAVIYEGAVDADAVAMFVMNAHQSALLTLTDLTFEHLTQASTGSTTGDWLLVFRSSECGRCVALQSRLEAVAVKLRARLSVAWLQSDGDAVMTAERLHATRSPHIFLLRQGVVYEYVSESYDVSSLSQFVVGLYKEAPHKIVPQIPTNALMFWAQIVMVGALLLLIVMRIVSALRNRTETGVKKSH